MTSADYLIRRPRPTDQPGLARLAVSLWGPEASDRFARRWWWHDDEPHCFVAEHRSSGELAAVCAQRRVRFLLAGTPRTASAVSDWYVAPDHAGSGLGKALVRRGEQTAAFMYTTAISDPAAAAFARLGWVGDRRIAMSAGIVAVAGRLAGRSPAEVELERRTVSAHDAGDLSAVDEVWERLDWPEAIMMVRDADQLRNHLTLAGERRYTLLIARRRGRPVGYLLHRVLPRHAFRAFGATRIGLVSDYLVDREDVAALRVLVGSACDEWRREGVPLMLILCGTDRHRRSLSGLGLLGPFTVGGRLIGTRMTSRSMHQPGPASAGAWHLTFADNDTDLILGGPG